MRTDPPGRLGGAPKRRPERSDHPQRRPAAKTRRDGNRELLYGRNAVHEALRGRRRVTTVLHVIDPATDKRIREIVELAKRRNVAVQRIDPNAMDDLLPGVNHQGVAAECGPFPYVDLPRVLTEPGPVLAFDHLQDPQNVGTLLRSSLAFGARGVLIPTDRGASITPAVVNASAGAVEHLLITRVINIARVLEEAKREGRWVVGLDRGPDTVPIWKRELPTPTVLVVGAEGRGLSQLVRSMCDLVVNIPMTADFDSLNAATSGAIGLYELSRQAQSAVDPAVR